MKIAVEGCCHGELDAIYDTIQCLEKKNNIKVDLLLICGDFQAVRNMADMHCMAVPPKHRQLNTFYKYYSGEKEAPVLTVFIGGNHEASNYLQEFPYGGWVAPKIYYMGYAGVLQFGGIRIGGLSGIFKGKDFLKGHFEHPPYSEESKRSAYHIRNLEVFRLKQLKQHVDIFLSHDWPRGIYKYGDVAALKRKKKFFIEEIEKDILGNPIATELLHHLQPDYWFSAHLHVKFPAIVQHKENDKLKITKFLALDKCLPRRQFLQVIDIPEKSNQPMKLQLDAEWLAILKSTNHMLNLTRNPQYPGGGDSGRQDFSPAQAEIESIKADFGGELAIPDNFQATAPAYDAALSKKSNNLPAPTTQINPQTTLLCSMLDLTDPNAVFLGKDSTFKLPDDSYSSELGEADKGDDNDDDDIEDDYDSEPSFISISSSDLSSSVLSTTNDSLLSVGNDSFLSTSNLETSVDDERGRNEERGPSSDMKDKLIASTKITHNKLNMKRQSLSERLKNCQPSDSGSGSDSVTSLNTSQTSLDTSQTENDDEDQDAEFAEIMKAQKESSISSEDGNMEINSTDKLNLRTAKTEILSPEKSEMDSEIVDSHNSSSSLDCKSLEITDEDDAELQEMLNAQRLNKKADLSKPTLEVAAADEDDEFQEIIASQKKNQSIADNFPDVDLDKPINQSSPIVNFDERSGEDIGWDKSGLKRSDTPKSAQSPASKKFKRRNQSFYVAEEG